MVRSLEVMILKVRMDECPQCAIGKVAGLYGWIIQVEIWSSNCGTRINCGQHIPFNPIFTYSFWLYSLVTMLHESGIWTSEVLIFRTKRLPISLHIIRASP